MEHNFLHFYFNIQNCWLNMNWINSADRRLRVAISNCSDHIRMKIVKVISEKSVNFTFGETDCIIFLFIALHFLHATAFVVFIKLTNVIIPIIPVWMLIYTKLQLVVVYTINVVKNGICKASESTYMCTVRCACECFLMKNNKSETLIFKWFS